MSYKLVAMDASTLILLAKIELLPALLERMEVAITTHVKKEATRKKELFDAQMIARLIANRRIGVHRINLGFARHLMNDFRLDEGEASSLALAQARHAVLGTDDGPTIKACKVLGVPFVTAIHLLVEAYRQRLMDSSIAMVKLEKLQRFGRYDPRILEDALKQIQGGEPK